MAAKKLNNLFAAITMRLLRDRAAIIISFFFGVFVGSVVQSYMIISSIDPLVTNEQQKLLRCLSTDKSDDQNRDVQANNSKRHGVDLDESDNESLNVKGLAVGSSKVPLADFLDVFDYNLPMPQYGTQQIDAQDEVLLLYPHRELLPDVPNNISLTKKPALLSIDDGLKNCNDIQVYYMYKAEEKRCLAVVHGFGVHHTLRWRREEEVNVKDQKRKTVSQSSQPKKVWNRVNIRGPAGRHIKVMKTEKDVTEHLNRLAKIMNHYDHAISELKPIADRIQKQNTILVMTCNMAFVTMLLNFVCSCRARGIDLTNLLVFTTDKESYDLLTSSAIGLNAFHTEDILGSMPSTKATKFGDKTFAVLSYAKMVSVWITLMLGYNVLFQDSDIVWFKDPTEYFHNLKKSHDYDIMFMDDGGEGTWMFKPFRANTGFFYARYTPLTRQLLTSFIVEPMLGVDQVTMAYLLNEHSVRHGLNVKILGRYDFPGGREFHHEQERRFTLNMIDKIQDLGLETKSETDIPYTWHMHYTTNRDPKIDYMRQAGMWHLNTQCVNPENSSNKQLITIENCCSVQPLISCHFPDKPSVKECRKTEGAAAKPLL